MEPELGTAGQDDVKKVQKTAAQTAMDKKSGEIQPAAASVQQSDSNYGSFDIGEETSSISGSALSIFSSSGFSGPVDTDNLSSSLSSDHSQNKAQKVKACLRKLRHLLPNTAHKEEGATVSALKQALMKIKQSQGTSCGEQQVDFKLSTEELQNAIRAKIGHKDLQSHALAVHKGVLVHCTEELETLLGYPKGYLINHTLRSLVHPKDESIIAFCQQSSTSSSDEEQMDAGFPMAEMAENPQEVYIRLRYYKSLRDGFNLRKFQYLTISATVTAASKAVVNTSEDSKKRMHFYYAFNCSALKPAYKVPMEVPEMAIFSTRHSSYCLYTYMHPSSIKYLGHLPQDIENTSIFDLYHPSDMPELYIMYEEVIKAGVAATCSKPYRLRVKNNDYILVETTWSCFIDPWTKKLEFLVGQHKVLQGPQHLDIFSGRVSTSPPLSMEADNYKKKIKDLFAMAGKSISGAQRLIENLHAPLTETPLEDGRTLDSTSPRGGPDDAAAPVVRAGTTEVAPSYSQVSYSQVIRNFLMTCPQTVFDPEIPTISMISKKLQMTAKGVHYEENTRVPVTNLSTVKPPSFCSSTKALLSEPDPMSPNPGKEMESVEDVVPQGGEVYKPTKLTKNVLRRHTKLQEQYFLQQMASAEAKELRMMPELRESLPCTGTKRPLQAKECEHLNPKRRNLGVDTSTDAGPSWDYQPLMEYSEMDFAGPWENRASRPHEFQHLSCSQCMMGIPQHAPVRRKAPSTPSLSGENTDGTMSKSQQFSQDLSSAHTEDIEGYSENDISASSSLFSLPSTMMKGAEVGQEESGCLSKPLYWPGHIMTVPSWLMIPNWTETALLSYKHPVLDMKTALLQDRQWLDSCQQSDYVMNQLRDAIGDCKTMMNESEQFFLFEPYHLPLLKETELSATSSCSYKPKGKLPNKHKLKRQKVETDAVAKVESGAAANNRAEKCDSGSGKCDSGIGTGEQSICDSAPFRKRAKYAKELDKKVKQHQSCQSESKPIKQASPNNASRKCSTGSNSPNNSGSKCDTYSNSPNNAGSKCETDSNSSNNDHDSTASGNDRDSNSGNDQDSSSLNDQDRSLSPSNNSKGDVDSDISSGITPSDQRSTGEVNSSLKESDGVSSKESGSTHSNSDCKPSKAKTNSDNDAFLKLFHQLFVPTLDQKRPVSRPMSRFSSTKLNTKVNPWLEDVNLSKKLEMEYTLESKVHDVLHDNESRNFTYDQSDMVRQQLDEFLEDVMKVGQSEMCEEAQNSENAYPELIEMIDPNSKDRKASYWTDIKKVMEMEGDLLMPTIGQVMPILNMVPRHGDKELDIETGSKSSSSASSLNPLSGNSVKHTGAQLHDGEQSLRSKVTSPDSGLACSMTSSSKDSDRQDKESMSSYKRSDEESSDTGRGKTSSKGSDGDGDGMTMS